MAVRLLFIPYKGHSSWVQLGLPCLTAQLTCACTLRLICGAWGRAFWARCGAHGPSSGAARPFFFGGGSHVLCMACRCAARPRTATLPLLCCCRRMAGAVVCWGSHRRGCVAKAAGLSLLYVPRLSGTFGVGRGLSLDPPEWAIAAVAGRRLVHCAFCARKGVFPQSAFFQGGCVASSSPTLRARAAAVLDGWCVCLSLSVPGCVSICVVLLTSSSPHAFFPAFGGTWALQGALVCAGRSRLCQGSVKSDALSWWLLLRGQPQVHCWHACAGAAVGGVPSVLHTTPSSV